MTSIDQVRMSVPGHLREKLEFRITQGDMVRVDIGRANVSEFVRVVRDNIEADFKIVEATDRHMIVAHPSEA